MSFLQQDLFDVTLELLHKAEVLTEKHRAVRAVTYNNLACYYRKRGKLRTALNYCRKALGIEAKMNENVKSADTVSGRYLASRFSFAVRCRELLGLTCVVNLPAIFFCAQHLNMCTILSELKRHEKAIVHARIALKLLLLELFGNFDQLAQQQQQQSSLGPTEHELIATGQGPVVEANGGSVAELRARLPPDRVAVLAIAYHNLGRWNTEQA
jgi:tetratricopeptide (TPR) repeat protein